MKWAEEHENWTTEDWHSVVYSDESKFNLWGSDGVQYCRSGPVEELEPKNVRPVLKHGGGSVMVWGCMTHKGWGRLVLIEGTMDAELYCSVLEVGLLKTLEDLEINPSDIIFQQDNDPKHKSRRAQQWFDDHCIDLLPWPPNSPDQNIIENAWFELEKAVNKREHHPTNTSELWGVLQEEWRNLPEELLDNLYDSCKRRLTALQVAKGQWTKY